MSVQRGLAPNCSVVCGVTLSFRLARIMNSFWMELWVVVVSLLFGSVIAIEYLQPDSWTATSGTSCRAVGTV